MARGIWRGPEIVASVKRGSRDGLEAAVAALLAASEEIVPYEKGKLAESGASGMVNDSTAAVTYTWPGAVPAHERVNVRPGRGRQRKYLETPFVRDKARWAEIIADRTRRQMR